MADNTEQFNWNESAEFSDDTIRRFLLGELDSAERPGFEEQFLINDELEARVRLGEFDLTDDYVFARLSIADRERFRQNFLVSADRTRKLDVSASLRERFVSASITESKAPLSERLRILFDFGQPAWRYAFAVLVLGLLIATVWLVTKEPQIANKLIPKRALPKPAPTASVQEANHSSNGSSTPTHPTQSENMPAHEPPALTVVLDPKPTIENAAAVKLPNGAGEVVRLQLRLEKNQLGTLRAEVLTLAGESVFLVESLSSADGLNLSFDVPARVMKSGAYQVKLSRTEDGSKTSIASYYFRVR